ncbi:hypothetical protein [Christiangramia echinicola]|uniref:hypothetical protein n=1 Tax=Christiangramia echinicola TaxID=279359 RepID=UPI00041B9A6E|nr:hypothetical protein [Christiangramia echinicola]
MEWIEILGPSGIGKSFFLKSLISERNKESNWLSIEEIKLKWVLKNSKKEGLVASLIKLYLRQDFVNSEKSNLTEILLDRKNAYLKEAEIFEELLKTYINHYIDLDICFKEKSYRISLFHKIIENLCLQDYYNIKNPIVMDEGPLSHHPDLIRVDWDNQKTLPNGLIFCSLSVEKNLSRIYKRKNEGRLAPLHHGLDKPDLIKHIEEKHHNYLTKQKILMTLGIPFIEINLDNVEPNILVKAQNFIKNVTK